MNPVIGQPLSRVEGRLKVTGTATYAAEFAAGELAYGVLVGATIAKGRIAAMDTLAAEQAAGVLAVLTHRNAPRLAYRAHKANVDPADGERIHMLQDDRVHYQGQHIALVIADTFEQATYAASLVHVTYQEEPAATAFDGLQHAVPPGPGAEAEGTPAHTRRGDPDGALQRAPVRIQAEYIIARENHNPIELHATIAKWESDTLILWDKTQWVDNTQAEIAAIFGMPAHRIRVISPFVGGGFGSALRTWSHVTLAALGARHVGRPVKIVLTRRQTFHTTGHRPYTVQRVSLGAERDGRLAALHHEGVAETSRYELFVEHLLNASRYMYACPNLGTRYGLAELDLSTPTYMRAPGEVSGMFALECAMDELAVQLGLDPIELRLRNEPERNEHYGLPFSSRSVAECYRVGAQRFGWHRRDPRPASMRNAQGLLVGYGCAAATYPVYAYPASARVVLLPDGTALVSSASSDMGPGTYTSMTQVAAHTLGLPIERVHFQLGDTRQPSAPVHGGAATMGSVGPAVRAACAEARRQALLRARVSDADADLTELLPHVDAPIDVTVDCEPGESTTRYSKNGFSAVFAEVTVDPELGLVRVPRLVGVYAAGRIINPKLARSQALGGMVMGLGMALLEQTVVDPRNGRVVNGTLADYLIPVNADIQMLDAVFVEEHDAHVNALGVKGVAELTCVGVAPAIANAVFHATGLRVRELPITSDKLLKM